MTTTIDEESLLQRNDAAYLSAEIDREMMLMDLESSAYIGMDKTTTQIWKLLDHPITMLDLIAKLTDIYDVTSEQCEADIRPVLEDMVNRNFIQISTSNTRDQ